MKGLLATTSERITLATVEPPRCIYRYPNPLGVVWRCQHPAVMLTTLERCNQCAHRSEQLGSGPPPILDPIEPLAVPAGLEPSKSSSPPPAPLPASGPRPETPRERRRRERRERKAQHYTPSSPIPDGKYPELICTRNGKPAGLENHWYGADCFVVLAGPSLKTLPLERLQERGIVTFAVNNAATVVKPNLWTCVDPIPKFHSNILRDPSITKLIPIRCLGQRIRAQDAAGNFSTTEDSPSRMPNTYGYRRHAKFTPETFLSEHEACWGNNKKSAAHNARPHILNVMFATLRLTYYLGFRRLFLLGCDFHMDSDNPYAFDEGKHASAAASNCGSYKKLITMFGMLKPVFDAAAFSIYNCNPQSKLTLWPYMSFAEAMESSTRIIDKNQRTLGWYQKDK